MTNVATSTPLTSTTSFQGAPTPGEGMILISEGASDEEMAYATGVSGGSLTTPLANRGLEGGSAQAHNSAVSVKGPLTVGMWNDMITALTNVLLQTTGALDTSKVVDLTTAQTLTTKRITKRVNSVASSATPAINTDTTDVFTITALALAITSMTSSLSGTPTNGQGLIIRFLDNGTARGITWGASFASRGATLPTTTTLGKYTYVGLIWNSTTSTWDCIATVTEA